MPSARIVKKTPVSDSFRAKRIMGTFDFTDSIVETTLDVNIPIEGKQWNIGLIVGSSGSGKTTIAKELFKDYCLFTGFEWKGKSFIDDFPESASVQDVISSCSSVGLNSTPDWLKPFYCLSNGQKMRAEIARALLEIDEPIIYDEFTSVVDRQVAMVTSNAISKYIRDKGKKFIACSCHRDIIDWLNPDFVYDVDAQSFEWRCLRRRPELELKIYKCNGSFWRIFKKYHYLNTSLNSSCHKFLGVINDTPVCFCATSFMPLLKVRRISRLVVLPDYQGLGIAKQMLNFVGNTYKKQNILLLLITSLPYFADSVSKDKNWKLTRCGHNTKKYTNKDSLRFNKSISNNRYTFSLQYVGE